MVEEKLPEFDRRAIPRGSTEGYWLSGDGHEIRQFVWPNGSVSSRGSILFLPGRVDSYEKYLECFHHWTRQGWNVGSLDWRGQAFSGRLGLDERTAHIDDFATWIADLAGFWRDWTRETAGPHVLIAHSMGGHLATRALIEELLDPAPSALVLSTPMFGVHPEWLPMRGKRFLVSLLQGRKDQRRGAGSWGETGVSRVTRQRLLTHDDARYADDVWWREQRPQIAQGPASWGWIRAALDSLAILEQPGRLEVIDLPVLLFATSHDPLVGIRAARRAAGRIRNCEALWFGAEARHEILRETDNVRDRALAGIDNFLERVCPE